MKRFLTLLTILSITNFAFAYENRNPDQPETSTGMIESPHGRINRLALGIYAERVLNKGGFLGEDDPINDYQLLPILTSSLPARELKGESIVKCGLFYEKDRLGAHSKAGNAIENTPGVFLDASSEWMRDLIVSSFNQAKCKTGDKSLTFNQWLVEAGFTADEPELWMSLRHFYDPLTEKGITDEHYVLAAALFKAGNLVLTRPEMNARTWAIRGQAQGPFEENHWSWENGIKAMAQATACTTSPEERDRLFAKSWRSLGETMHLMADMTVPAHVRNDGHAYKTAAGSLGPDPYEVFATDALIRQIAREAIGNRSSAYLAIRDQTSQTLQQDMNRCKKLDELFKVVATWTNHNFFSADTVSGKAIVNGKEVTVHNANGTPDFPSPKLEDCKIDSETTGLAPMTLYYREIEFGTLTQPQKRRVYMARLTWAVDNGWFGYFRTKVQCRGWEPNVDVCLSQAKVLIPLAIYANTYLVDWYIPRFRIDLDELDVDKGKLAGRVVHVPYGAHQSLTYNLPNGSQWKHLSRLLVDGKEQPRDRYSLEVKDGVLTCDVSELSDKITEASDIRVCLDLGGIWIKSRPYQPKPPTGYWVQEELRIDTRQFYKEKTVAGPFSLTSTWEVKDQQHVGGEFKQNGRYSVDLGKWANYSVEARGELNWQALPKVIAAGTGWEMHVTGSASYKIEPDNETVRYTAAERTTAEKDYTTNRTHWTYFFCPDYSDWWKDGCKGTPPPPSSRKHEAEEGKLDKKILLIFKLVPESERQRLPKMTMTYLAHTPVGYQNVVARYVYYPNLPDENKEDWNKAKASQCFKGFYVKP